jgi:hypothetical protein
MYTEARLPSLPMALALPSFLRVGNRYRPLQLIMYCSAAAFALLMIIYLSLGVFAGESYKVPRLGAVASLDARCSRIGTNVVREGGNAADAVGLRG